jgi:hypothetical protein
VGSTISGNGTSPFCTTSACGDLFAVERPRLDEITCTTSVAAAGGTWHVCQLD